MFASSLADVDWTWARFDLQRNTPFRETSTIRRNGSKPDPCRRVRSAKMVRIEDDSTGGFYEEFRSCAFACIESTSDYVGIGLHSSTVFPTSETQNSQYDNDILNINKPIRLKRLLYNHIKCGSKNMYSLYQTTHNLQIRSPRVKKYYLKIPLSM